MKRELTSSDSEDEEDWEEVDIPSHLEIDLSANSEKKLQRRSRKLKVESQKLLLTCYLIHVKYKYKVMRKNRNLVEKLKSVIPAYLQKDEEVTKNTLTMLSNWWKNYFGLKLNSTGTFSSITDVLIDIESKSAYEDVFVLLFAMICEILKIKGRFVFSFHLEPQQPEQTEEKEGKKKKTSFTFMPNFWMECWIDEKWTCVDCIRGIVADKTALDYNRVYVFSIDEDYYFMDICPVYCTQYLSKSIKSRLKGPFIEETLKSLNQNIPITSEKEKLIQDEMQEIEAVIKDEKVPTTISGFKNHPFYVLKQHLKVAESFKPKAKPAGDFRGQPYYRKEDVQKIYRRERWLRKGRSVKKNAVPIRVLDYKRGKTELFGEWQTKPYEAPTVKDRVIPINEFGRVELFHPSMLPKGCIRIQLRDIEKVCRLLGAPCAEVITDFQFVHGKMIPVTEGHVILKEDVNLILEAYEIWAESQIKKEEEKRKAEIWKKWNQLIKKAIVGNKVDSEYNHM